MSSIGKTLSKWYYTKREIERLEEKFTGWANILEAQLLDVHQRGADFNDKQLEKNLDLYFHQVREAYRDEKDYAGLFLYASYPSPELERINARLNALIGKTKAEMDRRLKKKK